jgi:hypothetical protein
MLHPAIPASETILKIIHVYYPTAPAQQAIIVTWLSKMIASVKNIFYK